MLEKILFLFKREGITYSIEFHKILLGTDEKQREMSIMVVEFNVKGREHQLKITENKKRFSYAMDINVSSEARKTEIESKRVGRKEILNIINRMINSTRIESNFLLKQRNTLPEINLIE
jgi:hypothetical protein